MKSSRIETCARMAMALCCLFAPSVFAGPSGEDIAQGSASIIRAGRNTIIQQQSDRLIVNWQSFDIAANEMVRFVQAPNAIALNRVVGGGGPSVIDGALIATGRVVLINPNGVLIGASGRIDTGSFIASTADISNDDFLKAKQEFIFNLPGNPLAMIENKGSITVAESGLAALVAPVVRNSGVIQGNYARIALAAGETFTLDFYGDGLISLAAGQGFKETLEASNVGSLLAEGGKIVMTAAQVEETVQSVVNANGVIEARTIENRYGEIILSAQSGDVNVGGQLEARTIKHQAQGDINMIDAQAITDSGLIEMTAGGSVLVENSLLSTAGGNITIGAGGEGLITLIKSTLNVGGSSAAGRISILAQNMAEFMSEGSNTLHSAIGGGMISLQGKYIAGGGNCLQSAGSGPCSGLRQQPNLEEPEVPVTEEPETPDIETEIPQTPEKPITDNPDHEVEQGGQDSGEGQTKGEFIKSLLKAPLLHVTTFFSRDAEGALAQTTASNDNTATCSAGSSAEACDSPL